MKRNVKKLNEFVKKPDSSGYYEILNYLRDINGSEEGEEIINGLYGESAMAYENAIERLQSIFPAVNHMSLEAAVRDFEREEEGEDYSEFVAESKAKKAVIKLNESQLRQIVVESVKKVLNEGVRNLEGLGEEIREIEAQAQELLNKIGTLENRVNVRYGYMPTDNDGNDDGIKKNLEAAYYAMKKCVSSLDDAFQYYDGGIE